MGLWHRMKHSKKMQKIICTILVGLIGGNALFASTNLPYVENKMLEADYWIDKLDEPNKIVMTADEIKVYNEKVDLQSGDVVNLAKFNDDQAVSKEKMINWTQSFADLAQKWYTYKPEDKAYLHYVGSKAVDASFYQELINNMDLQNIPNEVKPEYGVALRRSNMRVLPSKEILVEEPGNYEDDVLQMSAVLLGEPLRILLKSKDGKWDLVRSYNVMGWMPAEDIGVCDEREWTSYCDAKELLVVTANKLQLPENPYDQRLSELEFSMGVKLPLIDASTVPEIINGQMTLNNYIVKVPVADKNGKCSFELVLIPLSSDVSVGYLPYTRANVLNQVFKTLGDKYGWGGVYNNTRDCSQLMMEVYRVFGFDLPRNSSGQRDTFGKVYDVSQKTEEEKMQILNESILPGATLHFNGHVMMYIGEDRGRYFVISSLGAVYAPDASGTYVINNVMGVAINELSVQRGNKKTWLDNLTTFRVYEMPEATK